MNANEWSQFQRYKADAIRRVLDKAEGGPIAPTVEAVISALVQLSRAQQQQVIQGLVASAQYMGDDA